MIDYDSVYNAVDRDIPYSNYQIVQMTGVSKHFVAKILIELQIKGRVISINEGALPRNRGYIRSTPVAITSGLAISRAALMRLTVVPKN
ncbi:MAG: hypothetical protein ACC707_12750 [Thiohalomonadales bacterium]